MSKQDGYSSRTAVDLERKYNFGRTFAEVYGLISDAQRAAQEAQNAFDGLTQEQIFNLLTNYGEWQGIYRDDKGDVYVNASFIKGGTIKGDYVQVEAATITGQLVATQIDTKDLKVLAANITGTLTAGQIDTTNLTVSAANVTGKLTGEQIEANAMLTAPIIMGGEFYGNSFSVYPDQDEDGYVDGEGSFNLYGYYGRSNRLYHFLKIDYYVGDVPYINFGSPGGAYAYWDFTQTYFSGMLDFSGAEVYGLEDAIEVIPVFG